MPGDAKLHIVVSEAPLDLFLDEIHRVKATSAGTAETSYYPAVGGLLNAVGGRLKPRVFCLHHPSGTSGIPDFGLFEQAQFPRGEGPAWTDAVAPERGVVEVKGTGHSMTALLGSKQLRDQYVPAYGLVLAMNLWQFRLVAAGGAVVESFDLAADEAGFWTLVRGPRPDALRSRFIDFLQRCLLTRAPLTRPSEVAFFLASYAREALTRLTDHAQLPALANLRRGMEDALGIRFDERDGERLFRSTLVQTLFYGVFSAWVVHARRTAVLRLARLVVVAPHPGHKLPVPADRHPGGARPAGPGAPAGRGRRGARTGGARGLLRRFQRGASHPILLRAVPGVLRPGAAAAARRLVHPS